MARHSKWHNIKHRKAAQDAKRGKIFSIHSKLVALAAQGGGDPEKNATLFEAIEKAKADNVPSDNIDRAIKKGTGEDKASSQILEVAYEGYAPGGAAIIVQTLTDNKNRTASNIRHIFTKFGGNMGEPGSVSWIFSKKGVIIVDISKYDNNKDKVEKLIFETEAEDLLYEDGNIKIVCETEDIKSIKDILVQNDIIPEFADMDYIYSSTMKVGEFDNALKIRKMIDSFEEDEDVQDVYINSDIDDSLQDQVDKFIDKNTFKT